MATYDEAVAVSGKWIPADEYTFELHAPVLEPWAASPSSKLHGSKEGGLRKEEWHATFNGKKFSGKGGEDVGEAGTVPTTLYH